MKARMTLCRSVVGISGEFTPFDRNLIYFNSKSIVNDPDYVAKTRIVSKDDVEVYIEKLGIWKSLVSAMRDRDVITDATEVKFFEPKSELDRARGYAV